MDIKEKVRGFPDSCGAYLIKAKDGQILYVGKAASLKKRVGSYFQKPPTAKTQALLERAADIDYIQTSSCAQALLLENALIKRYQPYYNAALKDDKSYPYLKISVKDKYPCVSIVRGAKEKGAKYYGPYTNVRMLKAALKTLRRIFPLRSCRNIPGKSCLYFHLRLCPGVCVQKIDQGLYRENVRGLELFLEGRHKELFDELTEKMRQKAKGQLFEEAAALRDRINSLNAVFGQAKEPGMQDLILELQRLLDLPRAPYRIEAFDISEISGEGRCGSMVSFLGGWPDKKNYRRFKIKTVDGVDDYAMMREILHRRYSKIKEKDKTALPDLIIIDGGRGHLSSAKQELHSLDLDELAVVALAKRLETIYIRDKTINLAPESKLLHLLQRIRDEAHRFAIFYHRKLRQKKMRASSLDEIGGMGPKRKQSLLRHFGSLAAIKGAGVEDLLKVKGIDRRTVENIVKFLK